MGLRFPHDAEVGGGPSHPEATGSPHDEIRPVTDPWPVDKSCCNENQTAHRADGYKSTKVLSGILNSLN
jgi:hypothetical protein